MASPNYGALAQRFGGKPVDYAEMAKQFGATKSVSAHDALVASTKKKYPFINNSNPVLIPGTKKGGEGWPAGETGAQDYPRPKSIPLGRHGVEVGPGSTEADIAGEVLHVDPFAATVRDRLQKSLSQEQTAYLKSQALDYGDSSGGTEQHRMQNAVDSAIRGKLVGQWPDEANAGMKYTPQQQSMLNQLDLYMKTGAPTPQNILPAIPAPPVPQGLSGGQ